MKPVGTISLAFALAVTIGVTASFAAGTVVVNPSGLHFGSQKNGASGDLVSVTPPQKITVTFDGAPAAWTVTATDPWIHIDRPSAPGTGTFTVSIVNPNNVIGSRVMLVSYLHLTANGAPNSPLDVQVTLTVDQMEGEPDPPFGQVDTPAQNAQGLQGAVGISGWAVDNIGVSSVKVYRACFSFDNPSSCQSMDGASLVFVADAVFVDGARPDVESQYPGYPQGYRAGWGVQLLSNMLPHLPNSQLYGGVGTLSLFVYATDLEGQRVLLGRTTTDHTPTTIALANDTIAKPFGTLDTPGQGQTVAGTIANFGWAITPDVNTSADGSDIVIPTNGSTISVFIDGVAIGQATYNQCRGTVGTPPPAGVYCDDDVANIFGNASPAAPLTTRSGNPTKFRNLDAGRGPQAFAVLDTTVVADGMHTLAWSVTDSNGRVEGIGSRFFIVFNGDSSRATKVTAAAPASASPVTADSTATATTTTDRATKPGRVTPQRAPGSVAVRKGFDLGSGFKDVPSEGKGTRSISVSSGDRVELSFADGVTAVALMVNGQSRSLPVGATLDPARGTFAWMPPSGYFGTYRFVFTTASGSVAVDVTVK